MSLWLYSAVCWGVPLCLVTAMGVFGGAGYYGDQQTTGGWCWVRKHPAHGNRSLRDGKCQLCEQLVLTRGCPPRVCVCWQALSCCGY